MSYKLNYSIELCYWNDLNTLVHAVILFTGIFNIDCLDADPGWDITDMHFAYVGLPASKRASGLRETTYVTTSLRLQVAHSNCRPRRCAYYVCKLRL